MECQCQPSTCAMLVASTPNDALYSRMCECVPCDVASCCIRLLLRPWLSSAYNVCITAYKLPGIIVLNVQVRNENIEHKIIIKKRELHINIFNYWKLLFIVMSLSYYNNRIRIKFRVGLKILKSYFCTFITILRKRKLLVHKYKNDYFRYNSCPVTTHQIRVKIVKNWTAFRPADQVSLNISNTF